MKKIITVTLSIILISACGGGGGGGGTPDTPPPPASVNLSANPTSVLLGNISTLSWSSTNSSSCSASWTSSTATSGTEDVNITQPGDNSFSMTCSGAGGGGSASVTVEGYRNTDGVVVDGYISGAEVCIDENDNWTCDSNENSTTSDNDGKFTIKYVNGNLVSIGGTDLDSQTLLDNLLITQKLSGHSDFKAVTPVTSIAAFMEDSSLINAALGIDSSIDIFTFDPVASKGDGGIYDYLYEKGNQLTVLAYALQNVTNNLNSTTETTQDYFKAITEEIQKEYTETSERVDIETQDFLSKVLDNIIAAKSLTIDDTAKANTLEALSGVMPIIQVKSSDNLTTAVIRFSVSTLQTDIQTIANGTVTDEVLSSYKTDILNYIATDQDIDPNEITPDVFAIEDNVTTQEDNPIDINVLLNDSFISTAPITLLIVQDVSNGTIEIENDLIIYTPDPDHNGTDNFSYSIQQGDKYSDADVFINIEAVNDAPSIDIASTIQVDENQTAVTTVSISDVDEDELTLTLGGTNADSIDLSSENVLSFKEAPDYETKNSYSITLNLTDGVETVVKDIEITINNLNDNPPVFITSANIDIDENIELITTVSASDADGSPLTFSVSNTDEFSITSDGVLSFVVPADYETKTVYSTKIMVFDGIFQDVLDAVINVKDVNDNPPVIVTSGFSANENQNGIGSISATDVDTNTVLSYSLTGPDSESINVDNDGLLTFNENPDYENKSSYSITLNVSDGVFNTSKDISLQIENILEDIISSSFSIEQGTNTQPPVLNVALELDELAGAKRVYVALESYANSAGLECGGRFPVKELEKISSTQWKLTEELNSEMSEVCKYNYNYFIDLYDIDSETAPPTDGTHLTSGNKRMLKDLQYSIAYYYQAENSLDISNTRSVNTVSYTTNPLTGNSVNWLLYSPTQEYPTSCTTTSVTLANGEISPILAFNSNECSRQMFSYVLEDNQIKYDFYIYSLDELEGAFAYLVAPYKPSSSSNNGRMDSVEIESAILEIDSSDSRIASGSFAIDLTAGSVDQNYMNVTVYPLTKAYLMGTGSDNGQDGFFVDSPTDITPDIEPPELVDLEFSSYTNDNNPQRDFIKIDAEVTNESGSNGVVTSLRDLWIATRDPSCLQKTIYVRDALDGKIDTSITNISATIPFLKNELGTYQIESININDHGFTESFYGGLQTPPDDEFIKNELIGSTFTVGDGTSASCPLFLNILDYELIVMDENEVNVGSFTASGSQADTVIYTIEDSEHYSALGEDVVQIASKLQIDSDGFVTYVNPPDYDKIDDLDSGHFQVRATSTLDASLSRVVYRTIALNNLNDSPPVINTTIKEAPENQLSIGCVSHSDLDIKVDGLFECLTEVYPSEGESYPGNITFSVEGENILISSDGTLSFESAPDFEEVQSYVITVYINDGVFETSRDVTINVQDLNDNIPEVTSAKSYTVMENQASGGLIQIYDPDTVNVFSFTIDNDYEDGALFTINSNGELIFISNPDYETKNSYGVKVTINDGVNEITEVFSISLEDVIAEAIPTSAGLDLLPRDSNSVTVELQSYVLEGRTASFAIQSDPQYGTLTLDSSTGILNYTTSYADVAVETISFTVSDGVVEALGVANLTLNLNSDPAYKYSWYLDNTGQTAFASRPGLTGEDLNTDISISNGYTGKGVGVNVIDEGLEIAHEDLVENIKIGYSRDFTDGDTDPTNPAPYGDHGTSVAGIIAATGWNNVGGRGVAPDANLIGYNFLNYQCYVCEVLSWGYTDSNSGSMDIFNMSYGTNNYYSDGTFRFPVQNTISDLDYDAITNGVFNLRDGKGGIYIKSLGNSFGSYSTQGYGCGETDVDDEGALGCSIRFMDDIHTTPYIMGVGSLKATGIKSSYSTTDPSIWVSGFGGEFGYSEDYNSGLVERAYEPAMVTTDQSGCEAGYVSWYYYPRNSFNDCWDYIDGPHPENSNGNYTSTFNGTSSAAPSVAGGVAVLLEAYPELTWRDVKHVIANSARKNDPTRSYTRSNLLQYDWQTNAAGYEFHYWYGFGAYDLGAAIEFASTYTPDSLGTFQEYGFEESIPQEIIDVSVESNANGNVYVINGEQRKSIILNKGTKYTFNHPSAHPLRFSTTSDGIHNDGEEYTEGVTTSSGVTIIEVSEDAPITLYYYCNIHSEMGSDIAIKAETSNLNLLIPSFSSVENTISYSKDTAGDFVEFIQIKIYLDKDIPRDIGMHLISPQGTEMSILHPFSNVAGNPEGQWFIMGVSGFYGEKINGDWSLKITDYTDNDDEGTLIDWGINIYGH